MSASALFSCDVSMSTWADETTPAVPSARDREAALFASLLRTYADESWARSTVESSSMRTSPCLTTAPDSPSGSGHGPGSFGAPIPRRPSRGDAIVPNVDIINFFHVSSNDERAHGGRRWAGRSHLLAEPMSCAIR